MNLFYLPRFVKQYKKLPKALQEEVNEKIELFKENPGHPFLKTHKLKGHLEGSYSFSVNYSYRIVFEYLSKKEVALLCVGDHEIYN